MALLVAVLLALTAAYGPPLLSRGSTTRDAAVPGSTRAAAAADPEVERTYAEAKALIDRWGGRGEDLVRAGRLLEGILAKEPRHARAHVQLARVVYKLGYMSGTRYHPEALARARRLNDRALQLDPELPDAHVTGGYIALWQGRADEARVMATRAKALAPDRLDAAFLAARIDYEQRDLERARAGYLEILERASDASERAEAHEQLAFIYCKQKQYDACEAAHREVIRLDPDSAWAKGNYAQVLVRRKKWDEAIEYAKAALAQMDYPNARDTLSDAYTGKGWSVLEAGGSVDDAIEHFERAVEAHESNAYAHYGLGAAWYSHVFRRTDPARNLEFLDRAEASYRRAVTLAPRNETFKRELTKVADVKRAVQARRASR